MLRRPLKTQSGDICGTWWEIAWKWSHKRTVIIKMKQEACAALLLISEGLSERWQVSRNPSRWELEVISCASGWERRCPGTITKEKKWGEHHPGPNSHPL